MQTWSADRFWDLYCIVDVALVSDGFVSSVDQLFQFQPLARIGGWLNGKPLPSA